MSPRNRCRSFTVLLLITIEVLGSKVSAFTLDRLHNTTTPADLTEAANSQLEVKNHSKPDDVTVIDLENNKTPQEIIPIETTAKTEKIQKSSNTAENSESSSTTRVGTEYEIHETFKNSVGSTDVKSTKQDANELTVEDVTIVSTSSENPVNNQQTYNNETTTSEYYNATITVIENKSTPKNNTDISKNDEHTKLSNESQIDINTKLDNATSSSLGLVNNGKSSKSSDAEDKSTNDATTYERRSQSENTPYTPQMTSFSPSEKFETQIITNITNPMKEGTIKLIKSDSDKSTESLAGEYTSGTATPYWKKYTAIDRQRITTIDDTLTSTEKQEQMVKAGTAQSSISFRKSPSITSDIPSLEILKNELMFFTSKLPTTKLIPTNSTKTSMLFGPVSTSSTISHAQTTGTETMPSTITKQNIVSSKRAGFLDYSLKTGIATETTTNKKDLSGNSQNTKQNDVKDVTTTRSKTLGDKLEKKMSALSSQSQLAEDATNEELMKEEILSNKENYGKRYRQELFGQKSGKTKAETDNDKTNQFKDNVETSEDTLAEDRLSVRPINFENIKKSGIYTVSPNYKPLKKIEVQPLKPILRNPDDNSWRNESLSSLGIVFKAKNSSKPFTKVLKNKTETEWNTLLQKYEKGEEPELRQRLEKIAEMRKLKKKKIDKFGETVYIDYEESSTSGERMSKPKVKVPEAVSEADISTIPVAEIPELFPLSPSTDEQPTTEILDTMKFVNHEATATKIPVDGLTMDNYDGDDDDVDYLTPPNIDLKKFITSTQTSHVQKDFDVSDSIEPMRYYPPERKPTIQYFPPRKPQTVNVNDYDSDFQRKVNAYTQKNTYNKDVLPTTFSVPTHPSQKIVKEKTSQNIKRPTDFSHSRNPLDLNNNVYLTDPVQIEVQTQTNDYENQDINLNKSTYIVKTLGEYISEAARENDDDRNPIYTEVPLRGVTANDGTKTNKGKSPNDYYNDDGFRKDVLERFVENFNQNSAIFNVDFPVLYNTSVVHNAASDNGKNHASSSAFVKRLYDMGRSSSYQGKTYDPNCDRTVELSPAYELHYYFPEEEEKQEIVPKPITSPSFQFRL